AGFYYKTFMGPTRGAWMFYEPFIRRAAGLGKGTFEADPDRYEGRHDFADVLVIGSGPAGLAAAIAAGRTGARVTLVEQDALLGGSLLTEPVGGPADGWLTELIAELGLLRSVRAITRTTAAGLYDGNTVVLLERRDHRYPDPAKGEARQVAVTVRAKAIVFAAGALERPLVFSNNDRPGVMLAGAARTYLNRFAVSPGKRAIVVTNNDSAYRTGLDLAQAGLAVTLADLRRDVSADLRARATATGIELRTGTAVVDVAGRAGVYGARLAEVGSDAVPAVQSCDVVCMSGGWSPAVHLTSHGGIKPRYEPEIAAFVPGGFAAGQFGAGAVIGSFGFVEAVRGGFE
ncbi:MAG: FAD-dependent oxidoreductase, partial [Dongiaceae bacterium]